MNQKKHPPTEKCPVCGNLRNSSDLIPAQLVRPAIREIIRRDHPEWADDSAICEIDLNNYRALYVREVLESGRGEVSSLEKQVMKSIAEEEVLTHNVNEEFDRKLSFGNHLADRFAGLAGSWGFIIGFGLILFIWIIINSIALFRKPFDPYPYILLNLVLSCIAALQAPIIMMSQNRQEDKDRIRSEHDYLINLKAEIEIRSLHQKLDHLLMTQWQRLLEIQEIQTELMEEVVKKKV